MKNLIALLEKIAICSDRGINFVSNDGLKETFYSYADLTQRAKHLAAYLHSQGIKRNERVLLIYPPNHVDFIIAYFACIYLGVASIPVIPPVDQHTANKLQLIINDAKPKFFLTNTNLRQQLSKLPGSFEKPSTFLQHKNHPKIKDISSFQFDAVDWIETDFVVSQSKTLFHLSVEDVAANDPLFLQYTSGSTGKPKGVIVSHGNLIHNLELMKTDISQNDIVVLWIPHFHDMGLICGYMLSIYCHCKKIIAMSPQTFLRNPSIWLEKISEHKATMSMAPNFALDLCVTKIPQSVKTNLNLSCLERIYLGGEPIRAKTLSRFATYFSDYGMTHDKLKPAYGLAEHTLTITYKEKNAINSIVYLDKGQYKKNKILLTEKNSGAMAIVSNGSINPAMTSVIIVDPKTHDDVTDTKIVGEIWVASDSVATGYWNNEAATKKTFQAYTTEGNGPYLRTGDLGFIHDGELYISGRSKDLVIINGNNYYPQDIEETAEQSHPEIRKSCCAAFSVEEDEREKLYIALETKTKPTKQDALEIIRICFEQIFSNNHLAADEIILLPKNTLQKTSSGKIMRHSAKQNILAANYPVYYTASQFQDINKVTNAPHYSNSDNEKIICKQILECLADYKNCDIKSLDPTLAFATQDLTSLDSMVLTDRLNKQFNLSLPYTIYWQYPTPDKLAKFLSGNFKVVAETPSKTASTFKEPIAIIGMACRFPGDASTPESFWDLLINAGDAIVKIDPERLNSEQHNQDCDSKVDVQKGGFLKDIDKFDASFFNIAPKEALFIDPQQRLLLEVVWESLENAGIATDSLSQSKTGVFVGISGVDYGQLVLETNVKNAYAARGSTFSAAAGRIAYSLDLQGPAFAIDTACSSALVAIHSACQSLHDGGCDLAVSGGVNLILLSSITEMFAMSNMLSPDNRCKTFDKDANGYVRGEGCGIAVLKRLSDAKRDNDSIMAVIQGSVVNQDGASNGLSAPNAKAQIKLFQDNLAISGIDASQIDYIEAHGTGTPLGDSIEVNSISEVYSEARNPQHPLFLGAVKTNIGHTESAAGIASLIKTVLMLQHQEIPPNLHFNELNPQIDLNKAHIKIPTSPLKWDCQADRPRRAAVNTFGFVGTNAQLVLEEAPPQFNRNDTTGKDPRSQLIVFSAKDRNASKELATKYLAHFENNNELLGDIAYTSAVGRNHFTYRNAIVTNSCDELIEKLKTTHYTIGNGEKVSNITFLFSGQGRQYIKMGYTLYQEEPIFRTILNTCANLLADMFSYPFFDILTDESSELINHTSNIQPLLFCIEYSLAVLWMKLGIKPNQLIGHSVGEFVAATIAGVLTLPDALTLVVNRGKLMQSLPTARGGMLSLQLSLEKTKELIHNYDLDIACINASQQTIISGCIENIRQVMKVCKTEGIFFSQLNVSHAFHSSLIEPMIAEFKTIASKISYKSPKIDIISTVTGEVLQNIDADYWCEQILKPVNFMRAIKYSQTEGKQLYLEIGPAPVLTTLGKQCLATQDNIIWATALNPKYHDRVSFLNALAQCYVAGVNIDWNQYYHSQKYQYKKILLPTYAFQRQRYWALDNIKTQNLVQSSFPKTSNIYLDGPLILANQHCIYEHELTAAELKLLCGHVIFGKPIMPGPGYMALMLMAGQHYFQQDRVECFNLEIVLPMLFQSGIRYQILLQPKNSKITQVTLYSSYPHDDKPRQWSLHAKMEVQKSSSSITNKKIPDLKSLRAQAINHIDKETFYKEIAVKGYEYAGVFKGIESFYHGNGVLLTKINFPSISSHVSYDPIHLDICLHVSLGNLIIQKSEMGTAYLPVGIGRAVIHQPIPKTCYVYSTQPENDISKGYIQADMIIYDAKGGIVAEFFEVNGRKTSKSNLKKILDQISNKSYQKNIHTLSYVSQWEKLLNPVSNLSAETISEDWLVIFENSEHLSDLKQKLAPLCPNAMYFCLEKQSSKIRDELQNAISSKTALSILYFCDDRRAQNTMSTLYDINLKTISSLLNWVQKLSTVLQNPKSKFWLITNCINYVVDEQSEINLAQASLKGFIRSLILERPDADIKHLDFSNEFTECVPQLIQEMQSPSNHSEMSYRNNYTWIENILPKKNYEVASKELFVANRTYIITGGLGGIGWQICQWLISHGVDHIVLLGRRKIDKDKQSQLMKWSNENKTVNYYRCDISKKVELENVLSQLNDTMPPVFGVFHAAGVVSVQPLSEQKIEAFASEFQSKIAGTCLLKQLLSEQSPSHLDFMVLFSSISASLGSPGMLSYAASNSFMDSFARYSQFTSDTAEDKCRVVAVNWGPFADVGMINQFQNQDKSDTRLGLRALPCDIAFTALETILMDDELTTINVADIDWNEANLVMPKAVQRVKGISHQITSNQKDMVNNAIDLNQMNELFTLHASKQKIVIEEKLKSIISQITQLPMASIHSNMTFLELGFDSLMAVEFKNHLQALFTDHIQFPAMLIFEYPNLSQVIEFIQKEINILGGRNNETSNLTEPVLSAPSNHAEKESVPLMIRPSKTQERLYFMNNYLEAPSTNHEHCIVEMHAKLDEKKFKKALTEMIKRHEVLRTQFKLDETKGLMQEILPTVDLPLEVIFVDEAVDSTQESLSLEMIQAMRLPFDLHQAPLWRIVLTHINQDHCSILFVFHHAIIDGYSLAAIFFKELFSLYTHYLDSDNGRPILTSTPAFQYREYCLWEEQWLSSNQYQDTLKYWSERLHNYCSHIFIKPDMKPVNNSLAFKGNTEIFSMSIPIHREITKLSKSIMASPYSMYFGALFILMHLYTKNSDIIIGTAFANRVLKNCETGLGCFMNVIPFRTQVDGSMAVIDFLEHIEKQVKTDFVKSQLPYDAIMQSNQFIKQEFDGDLLETFFLYQVGLDRGASQSKKALPFSLHIKNITHEIPGTVKEPIGFEIIENDQALYLAINYRKDLYSSQLIKKISTNYMKLIEVMTQNSQVKIGDIILDLLGTNQTSSDAQIY